MGSGVAGVGGEDEAIHSRRLDEIIEQVRHIAFDIERDDTHKVDAIRRLLAPESDARPGSGGGPLTWSDVFDCYGHDIADLI